MASPIKFHFDTTSYQQAYGHAPKGFAVWIFYCLPHGDSVPTIIKTSEAMPYAEAKRFVKTQIFAKAPKGWTGDIDIEVWPAN